jgi:hypothetical protein
MTREQRKEIISYRKERKRLRRKKFKKRKIKMIVHACA